MRAIVIREFGGPDVLTLRELSTPIPGRDDVRVRIRATAVNRADLLQRMGLYPAPPDAPSDIPGLEFAGEIDAVGEAVTGLAPGDRVFGLAGGGTYAEALVVHARTVAKMPASLSFREAAAIPEAFITAYDAMVVQAGLSTGQTVLIHAVGSGVGTAAVQVAKEIGARTIGTARTGEKLERAKDLGLDCGIAVSQAASFASDVLAATSGHGVDVVLELVGGGYVAEDLKCVANGGRIVVVGLMAGVRTEIDLATLLRKRIELRGTVLRSRPLEEKIAATEGFARHVVPLIASGAVRAIVDRVWPLESAAEAHAYVASNRGFGKVVLEISP